jgi:hypothetical protein
MDNLSKTSTSTAHLIGKELIVERSSRLVARNRVDGDYQKTFVKKRKACKRVP